MIVIRINSINIENRVKVQIFIDIIINIINNSIISIIFVITLVFLVDFLINKCTIILIDVLILHFVKLNFNINKSSYCYSLTINITIIQPLHMKGICL